MIHGVHAATNGETVVTQRGNPDAHHPGEEEGDDAKEKGIANLHDRHPCQNSLTTDYTDGTAKSPNNVPCLIREIRSFVLQHSPGMVHPPLAATQGQNAPEEPQRRRLPGAVPPANCAPDHSPSAEDEHAGTRWRTVSPVQAKCEKCRCQQRHKPAHRYAIA